MTRRVLFVLMCCGTLLLTGATLAPAQTTVESPSPTGSASPSATSSPEPIGPDGEDSESPSPSPSGPASPTPSASPDASQGEACPSEEPEESPSPAESAPGAAVTPPAETDSDETAAAQQEDPCAIGSQSEPSDSTIIIDAGRRPDASTESDTALDGVSASASFGTAQAVPSRVDTGGGYLAQRSDVNWLLLPALLALALLVLRIRGLLISRP